MLRPLLLGVALGAASAASMNVHSIVGLRATSYYAALVPGGALSPELASAYQDAIDGNLNAVLGGSDFPDFLYACGEFADHHDAGEAAHWPPFHKAAVSYARDTIANFSSPATWTDDTRRLVAFTFGLAVHYVTDELWEGLAADLGTRRGFTELVDAFDRGNKGEGNVAEGVANFGGDFFASHVLDEGRIDPWARFFPLEHLVQIYARTPKNATANYTDVGLPALAVCRVIFDLGLWALQTFGPLLYRLYNELLPLPFVTEHLFDAPLSGVDDMGAAVTFAWNRLARWYVEGPPAEPPPHSVALARAVAAEDDADDRSTHALLARMRPFESIAAKLRSLPPAEARAAVQLVTVQPLPVSHGRDGAAPSQLAAAPRSVEVAVTAGDEQVRDGLAGIVATLVEHFTQGKLRVVRVSPIAPAASGARGGGGSREVVGEVVGEVATAAAAEAALPVAYNGSAIVVGDFDSDGSDDIAVGALGLGVRGAAPRSGGVSLRYGGGREPTALNGSASANARFGEAMGVLDFNLDGVDDLAVGSPGESGWDLHAVPPVTPYPFGASPSFRLWGRVTVYFGRKGRGLRPEDSLVVTTSSAFTALGSVVSAGDADGDGAADLLLGCVAASGYAGRVVLLTSSSARRAGATIDLDSAPVLADLHSPEPYGWFGSALAVVGSTLLVGAPYARADPSCSVSCEELGRVYGYELSGLRGRTHRPDRAVSAGPSFSLLGDVPLGGFGRVLAAGGGAVGISAPDSEGEHGAAGAGAVYLLNASSVEALHGAGERNISAVQTLATVRGLSPRGRLGLTLSLGGTGGAPALVVSAPHEDEDADFASREMGVVWAWAALPTGERNTSSASRSWRGARPRGQFGRAIAIARGAARGAVLLVGSPRATVAGAEQAGCVDEVQVGA
jgi:hypothetical protein